MEAAVILLVPILAYALLPRFTRPRWERLVTKNGENSLFHIRVDPNSPRKLAVAAHELAEWQYKYRRPWLWMRWRGDGASREVNLWGPAVETAAAVKLYRVDENAFIQREAWALARRDYFRGFDQSQIEAEIRKRLPRARKWLQKNLQRIEAL